MRCEGEKWGNVTFVYVHVSAVMRDGGEEDGGEGRGK